MADGSGVIGDLPGTLPVVISPEPFTPRVESLEAVEGQPVWRILQAALKAGHLQLADLKYVEIYVDGVRLEDRAAALDFVPAAGSVLNIAVQPQGGGGRNGNKILQTILTIAVIAVSFWVAGPAGPLAAMGGGAGTFANVLIRTAAATAINTLGSMAINAAFGPKLESDNSSGKAKYGLQGQSNRDRRSEMFPLVLGKQRVWFDVASSAYTETVGEDVFLHVIFGIHYGPCALDVATLKLGETLFSTLADGDVTYELALTPGPRAFTLYPMRTVQESYTDNLDKDTQAWVIHTTAEDCEKISVDIALPGGLYYTNEKGKDLAAGAAMEIQYKAVGSGTWLLAPLEIVTVQAGPLTQGSVYLQTMTKDAVTLTRDWTVAKGQYDVRIRRMPQMTGELGQFVDATYWVAMRTIENKTPVVDQTLSCMAVRFKATSTVNGTLAAVSAEVEPICPIYSGGNWNTSAATSNAAALTRWLLTGPATAQPLSYGEVDASCATQYARIVDRNLGAGILVANGESQEDVINRLSRAGNFECYWNGSKLCFVPDGVKALPRQMFTGRTAQGYRYKRSYPDPVHALRVTFRNVDEDARDDELVVYNDGYDLNSAELYEGLDLALACTPQRAWREARRWMAKRKLHVESHEWTADLDGVVATFGARVRVRHKAGLIGLTEGRVRFRRWAGGLVSGLRLDEPVTYQPGETYAVDMRRWDGLILDAAVVNLASSAAVTTREIVFSTPLVATACAEKGDLVAFGISASVTEDLELVDVSPQGKGQVAFVGRAYKAEEIEAAETGEIPPLDTKLSTKAKAPRPAIRGAKGSPEGVTVYFAIEGQRTSLVGGFAARWRYTPGTGDDSVWRDLPVLGATARQVQTPPVIDAQRDPNAESAGVRVDVEIRSFLENGEVSEPGEALNILIVRDVAQVTNFSVIGVIRSSPDGSTYPVAQVSAAPFEAGLVQDLVVELTPASGGPNWVSAGPPLPAANPTGDFTAVKAGETYDFRARWRTSDGWSGPWAIYENVFIPDESVISWNSRNLGGKTATQWSQEISDLAAQGTAHGRAVLELVLRNIDTRKYLEPLVWDGQTPLKTVVHNEITERIDGDTAIVEVIDLIGAVSGDGLAFVLNTSTVKIGPTETLATRLSQIQSDLGANSAAITSEASTRATADTAFANAFSLLGAVNGGGTAFVLNQSTTFIGPTESLATRLSQIQSDLGSNSSAITSEASARTTADSALASLITSLTATVGGHTSSISSLFTADAVLGAKWGIATNSNGHVAGIILNNGGGSSAFIVQVDAFAVITAAGTSVTTPFAITGGVTYLENAWAKKLVTGSAGRRALINTFPGAYYDDFTEAVVATLNYTAQGGDLKIDCFATCSVSTTTGFGLRLYRDGFVVADFGDRLIGPYTYTRNNWYGVINETPGAHTYEVRVISFGAVGNYGTAINGSIFVTESYA